MKLPQVRRLTFGLLALFCVLLALFGLTKVPLLAWLSIGLVLAVGLVNHLLWRCPHCGKPLGRMERQAHCCHCGKELEM